MKRSEVQAEALKYEALKTRWRNRGRTAVGCDCVGLLTLVGDHFGVPYEDVKVYPRLPNGDRMVDHLKRFLTVATTPPLKPGQIVILRDDILPCHVGILIEHHGALWMVHASLSAKKVVKEPFDRYWLARFRVALEFPGIEEG